MDTRSGEQLDAANDAVEADEPVDEADEPDTADVDALDDIGVEVDDEMDEVGEARPMDDGDDEPGTALVPVARPEESGPESRSPGRMVAVALGLVLVLVVGVVVVLTRDDDGSNEATGGDPPATTTNAGEPSDATAQENTDVATDDGGAAPAEGDGTASSEDGEPQPEPGVPSPPQAAGPESDRPVVTYPQPTVPDGGCQSTDGTVVIELGDEPSPPCVEVRADQEIVFRNTTSQELSLTGDLLNEVIPSGGELTLARAADWFPEGRTTFWSPGNPTLSGFVELTQ